MIMYFKNFNQLETSLVVQWLRICASTAEGMVAPLVRELRSGMPPGAAKKKKVIQLIWYITLIDFWM